MLAARLIQSIRAPLAAFLAALVLLVTGLVHLPELHRALHPAAPVSDPCPGHGPNRDTDAYPLSSDDLCAVALFAQGLDAPWQTALLTLPASCPIEAAQLGDQALHLSAPAWRHPPAQAPPARIALLA